MYVNREIERLGRSLAELAHSAGFRLLALSRELGHHENYLTRTFRGRLPLKVEDVFRILAFLRVDPEPFFELLYPFGGAGEAYMLRHPPAHFRPDEDLNRHRLKLRAEKGEASFGPREWAAKAARCLRELLRRKRITQREASVAAGMGLDALGQALRGNTVLTFQHIFAALDVCGSPPGRFFTDLFGAPDGDLLDGLRWSMYLDELEEGFADFSARAAAQLQTERGQTLAPRGYSSPKRSSSPPRKTPHP